MPSHLDNEFLHLRLTHVVGEQLFVQLHPLDEQRLQHLPEHQLELVQRVDLGCLLQRLVPAGRLGNLVEEQLVRLVEFAAETLVDDVDQA
jgi:hypothetical protein